MGQAPLWWRRGSMYLSSRYHVRLGGRVAGWRGSTVGVDAHAHRTKAGYPQDDRYGQSSTTPNPKSTKIHPNRVPEIFRTRLQGSTPFELMPTRSKHPRAEEGEGAPRELRGFVSQKSKTKNETNQLTGRPGQAKCQAGGALTKRERKKRKESTTKLW